MLFPSSGPYSPFIWKFDCLMMLCSLTGGKVLNSHTVLGVNAYLCILLMEQERQKKHSTCRTTSFGGIRIYRRLQEDSSAAVRCFWGLNWRLFRSTPIVCWVTKDSKPDSSLEGWSNDWVSVILVSDVCYPMCIRVLALLLKNDSLP